MLAFLRRRRKQSRTLKSNRRRWNRGLENANAFGRLRDVAAATNHELGKNGIRGVRRDIRVATPGLTVNPLLQLSF